MPAGQIVSPTVPEKAWRAKIRVRVEMAALRLYIEHEMEDVTAADIAKAAGISRRTFFRYFPTLDDVLAGLYTRAFVRHIDKLRDRSSDEPLVAAWAAVIDDSEMWEELEQQKLSRQVSERHPEAINDAMDRASRLAKSYLEAVLSARLGQAPWASGSVPAIAATLIAVNRYSYVKWLHSDGGENFSDLLIKELRIVTRALS